MFNVGSILGSEKANVNEYYELLGCDENSTEEQIAAEYKLLAKKFHPDKNYGNHDTLEMFQKLQEARDTLTNSEKRRLYDKWRRSEVSISFKQWLSLADRCQPTMHWVKPKTQVMIEGIHPAPNTRSRNSSSVPDINSLINPTKWVPGTSKVNWESDKAGLYGKFRNYEI